MPLNLLAATPNLFRSRILTAAAACFYLPAPSPLFRLLADSSLREVPAPHPLRAEQKQLEKLDVALAPLFSAEPSASDVKHLKKAVAAVRKNDIGRFNDAKAKLPIPSGASSPIGSGCAPDWRRSGIRDLPEGQSSLALPRGDEQSPGRSAVHGRRLLKLHQKLFRELAATERRRLCGARIGLSGGRQYGKSAFARRQSLAGNDDPGNAGERFPCAVRQPSYASRSQMALRSAGDG